MTTAGKLKVIQSWVFRFEVDDYLNSEQICGMITYDSLSVTKFTMDHDTIDEVVDEAYKMVSDYVRWSIKWI